MIAVYDDDKIRELVDLDQKACVSRVKAALGSAKSSF